MSLITTKALASDAVLRERNRFVRGEYDAVVVQPEIGDAPCSMCDADDLVVYTRAVGSGDLHVVRSFRLSFLRLDFRDETIANACALAQKIAREQDWEVMGIPEGVAYGTRPTHKRSPDRERTSGSRRRVRQRTPRYTVGGRTFFDPPPLPQGPPSHPGPLGFQEAWRRCDVHRVRAKRLFAYAGGLREGSHEWSLVMGLALRAQQAVQHVWARQFVK